MRNFLQQLWFNSATKRHLKTNNIIKVFLVVFMVLYVHDHRELNRLREHSGDATYSNINHRERLEKRKVRLKEVCESLNNSARVEHSSIFQKRERNNECTGTYFKVAEKDHFICFALKSGSTSWQVFFAENQIKTAFIADCAKNSTCPKYPEVRILQVRHPFERLLSTYRHLFKNGGWKSLELNKNEEVEDTLTTMFSKSWQEEAILF